jgi:O-methyltransferase
MTNDIRWFRKTMEINKVGRVVAFQGDASSFDYSSLGPLAFVIIDVDLHRPVSACLDAVWELLSSGGVILVDDCSTDNLAG